MKQLVAPLRRRARIALAIAVLAPLLAVLDLPVPGRLALAVAFVLLVPGVAVAEAVRLPSDLATWCLAVAVSLAVNLLVAQGALVIGVWVPVAGSTVIALFSIALLAWVARRARASARASAGVDA